MPRTSEARMNGQEHGTMVMSPDDKWNQRRAVTALLEIADEALMAAQAVAPDGRVILTERIHEAREAVLVAKQRAEVDL